MNTPWRGASGLAGPVDPADPIEETWWDRARQRQIPLLVHLPAAAVGRCPVIVMSHGLGWSQRDYTDFGRCWAAYGYVCVHPEHLGTSRSAWRENPSLDSLRNLGSDPTQRLTRVRDITFILDHLVGAAWNHRVDSGLCGVAGHSYGAHTALTLAGQALSRSDGTVTLVKDRRVRAVIAMSPAAPDDLPGWSRRRVLQLIDVPCLHLTGTEDRSPMGFTRVSERRAAFDEISHGDQYLLILAALRHETFAETEATATPALRPALRAAKLASLAFWDAYLRGSEAAKAWLKDPSCAAALGSAGHWEWR